MNYQDFICFVSVKVQEKMAKGECAQLHRIVKNNGVELDGLSVSTSDNSISPTIYLNDYFDSYSQGMPICEIVDHIMEIYEENKVSFSVEKDFYTEYEQVKKFLACKIINYEKNRELLKKVPYKRYLDLAVVFYYSIKHETIGDGSILIYHSHMKMWKVNRDILYEDARGNTPILLPYDFKNMKNVIMEFEENQIRREFPDVLDHENEQEISMFVLTNSVRYLGAACMLYDHILEEIGNIVEDDFYILPSSIHECIIVPARHYPKRDELQQMVREINQTQVKPEEVLSDQVYIYNREFHRLSL